MKKRPLLLSMVTVVAGFYLSGCDTFKNRADEKSEVYDSLSSATQRRLERGKIRVGDTEDLVYIALGNPDEKRDLTKADGNQSIWIYRTYWEQYEGTAWTGWHRSIGPGPGGRGYVVYHEPITQDVYRQHVDEVIRVTFARGAVSSIEQQKR